MIKLNDLIVNFDIFTILILILFIFNYLSKISYEYLENEKNQEFKYLSKKMISINKKYTYFFIAFIIYKFTNLLGFNNYIKFLISLLIGLILTINLLININLSEVNEID